jgi:hypothetical protein
MRFIPSPPGPRDQSTCRNNGHASAAHGHARPDITSCDAQNRVPACTDLPVSSHEDRPVVITESDRIRRLHRAARCLVPRGLAGSCLGSPGGRAAMSGARPGCGRAARPPCTGDRVQWLLSTALSPVHGRPGWPRSVAHLACAPRVESPVWLSISGPRTSCTSILFGLPGNGGLYRRGRAMSRARDGSGG